MDRPAPGSLPSISDAARVLGADLAAHARSLADTAPPPTREQLERLRAVITAGDPDVTAAA